MAKCFVCSHCLVKQHRIGVISKCSQTYNLETCDYDDLNVMDTLEVFCVGCGKTLPPKFKKYLLE